MENSLENNTSLMLIFFKLCILHTNAFITFEIWWERSDKSGIWTLPSPPFSRAVFVHAKWVKWESTEHAMTSALIERNSFMRSENATISVGQTNVLKWVRGVQQ